jgi:hypothetical protein
VNAAEDDGDKEKATKPSDIYATTEVAAGGRTQRNSPRPKRFLDQTSPERASKKPKVKTARQDLLPHGGPSEGQDDDAVQATLQQQQLGRLTGQMERAAAQKDYIRAAEFQQRILALNKRIEARENKEKSSSLPSPEAATNEQGIGDADLAAQMDLFECEKGCGFESHTEDAVIAHEAQCTGSADEGGLCENDAVKVQWQKKTYDAVVVTIDRSRRSKPIQVQFEGDWSMGWVDEKHVESLEEATESMLPEGVAVGGQIEAQDPFGRGAGSKKWHTAKLEQALVSKDGQKVRFWVKFEKSGMSQWCWQKHVKACADE